MSARTLAATVLAGGVLVASATVAVAAPARPDLPAWQTHPCKSEDSVNCYWNAHTMGNGQGLSYYVRELPGRRRMVCVFYVARPRLDYCA